MHTMHCTCTKHAQQAHKMHSVRAEDKTDDFSRLLSWHVNGGLNGPVCVFNELKLTRDYVKSLNPYKCLALIY